MLIPTGLEWIGLAVSLADKAARLDPFREKKPVATGSVDGEKAAR